MKSKGLMRETQAIQYNSLSLSSKFCCFICTKNIMSYNTTQWSIVAICFLLLHSLTQTFTPRVLRFGARLSVIYAFAHTALFVCNHLMMMMMEPSGWWWRLYWEHYFKWWWELGRCRRIPKDNFAHTVLFVSSYLMMTMARITMMVMLVMKMTPALLVTLMILMIAMGIMEFEGWRWIILRALPCLSASNFTVSC